MNRVVSDTAIPPRTFPIMNWNGVMVPRRTSAIFSFFSSSTEVISGVAVIITLINIRIRKM